MMLWDQKYSRFKSIFRPASCQVWQAFAQKRFILPRPRFTLQLLPSCFPGVFDIRRSVVLARTCQEGNGVGHEKLEVDDEPGGGRRVAACGQLAPGAGLASVARPESGRQGN